MLLFLVEPPGGRDEPGSSRRRRVFCLFVFAPRSGRCFFRPSCQDSTATAIAQREGIRREYCDSLLSACRCRSCLSINRCLGSFDSSCRDCTVSVHCSATPKWRGSVTESVTSGAGILFRSLFLGAALAILAFSPDFCCSLAKSEPCKVEEESLLDRGSERGARDDAK